MGTNRLAAICALALPLIAAAPEQGTDRPVDTSLRFGAIAAISPLCGLRDPAWAADLWRAELQAMVGPRLPGPPDAAKQRMADRAGATLSFAEDEALESFAEAAPEATCAPLAHDPDLRRADEMVAAFRARAGEPIW